MSATVLGAYIAMASAIIVAVVSGWLGRRPSRLVNLDVMQASLDQLEKDYARVEHRAEKAEARLEHLEAEVEACEKGRHDDRRRFDSEIAEMRRTLAHLTRRTNDP